MQTMKLGKLKTRLYNSVPRHSPIQPIVISIFERDCLRSRGPFLERPGKLTGPVSSFVIEASRKVGCVRTSNEVHFVSLANNFTV